MSSSGLVSPPQVPTICFTAKFCKVGTDESGGVEDDGYIILYVILFSKKFLDNLINFLTSVHCSMIP